ncbi:MAG: HAD-IA family hydrolase [Clostridia bacterium]|nr:HAD-IA family hydrolase [Clostridia bacterium]
MISLVIFDMDGVLIDSEDAITLCAMDALREGYCVNASYDDFKEFTGMGEVKFIGGVAEKYGVPFCPEMKDSTYRIYCDTANERVKVYPWSDFVVDSVLNAGFKAAVGSAADEIKVMCNIRRLNLDTSKLASLVTASEVVNKKPDPEIFLKAAEKAGIAPSLCLVVEDAVSGVIAAKRAGMTCIAVTTSFDADTLKNAGADMVVDDLSSLAEYVKRF